MRIRPGVASSAGDDYPKPIYSWYVVTILLFAYVTLFLDRAILTLLFGPILASVEIADLELSLLRAFAFTVFYVSLGIPIPILVLRRSGARYCRESIEKTGGYSRGAAPVPVVVEVAGKSYNLYGIAISRY